VANKDIKGRAGLLAMRRYRGGAAGVLSKAYYKGGFEPKMNRREAALILQLKSVYLIQIFSLGRKTDFLD
jgi:hypothetical protein